jgi:hypothetical protein
MNKRTKRILLVFSLVALVCALTLLIYGLMPIDSQRQIFQITPTLLAPPAVLP